MHSRLIQAQTHSGRQVVTTSIYTGSQLAFLVPQKQMMRLVSYNHTCRRKTPLISATQFCSKLQCKFSFTEKNAGTTLFLDQSSTCHTLLSSRCFRTASALGKSRMIYKHTRSCSFFLLFLLIRIVPFAGS